MKIAIHNSEQEVFFSNRWIEYCKKKNIPFVLVNAYDNNIIDQIADCDAFMWHHSNYDYRDALFAKQLTFALHQAGKKVFPDFKTNWHFDDKVGQKYLLESIAAPLVPSYVFYTKNEALKWINTTTFPKVFKLRGGSGSSNVKLVNNKTEAIKLVKRAFRNGFHQFNKFTHLKFRYINFKSGRESIMGVIKGFVRLFIGTKYSNNSTKEKGYVYFQDFLPGNKFDIRVIVIGDKAFALKRMVRRNDFRASGGGNIVYDKNQIDERCIKIAFDINIKLEFQCAAYDFVFDNTNHPLIVEISYGFDVHAYDLCEGYWDSKLNWHKGKFNPQEWMVEDLLNGLLK